MKNLHIRFEGPRLTKTEVEAIEYANTKLPFQYAKFLLQYNGGTPDVALFDISQAGLKEVVLETLLSMDKNFTTPSRKSLGNTIASALDIYGKLLPPGQLPIGFAGVDTVLLLDVMSGKVSALFVMDGEASFDEDWFEIANSFDEFIDGLYGNINPHSAQKG